MEEIISVIIVSHTRESAIVSSRRCPIVFLQLGLKFPSDREYFLVEIYIFISLVLFRPCVRVTKVGGNEVIDHM